MNHRVIFLCASLSILTGCSPSPVKPAAVVAAPVAQPGPPPAPPPAPAPAPAPASMLSVSAFTVQLFRGGGSSVFQYEPATLELAETSGMHAATLIEFDVRVEGGEADLGCHMTPMRIEPGGRLDLVKALGYCMPYAVTRSEASAVTVRATFRDDLNASGTVQKTVSVQGCTLSGATGAIACK